ncbi:50S ribosomal protein L18 [Candidatus Curtissbacteria bacterium RBG_13_35_7]|uniref:Large ribosomal subunit protein uL18 n=1 Tax=Candidatus Curtissbacteria bacterium RBG_13_35_7 TaxID=1797705 RepID=A0A1F5G0X4_9BACT|nr:MAG: 50S ribosomal protein L18 [Candidatus Curtissbacteria bacterium RBG_13_35_7]
MNKKLKRSIRHKRIRNKIVGKLSIPRLSIFRSNKNIFAQLIDDENAKTLISASTFKIAKSKKEADKGTIKNMQAFLVGQNLANLAIKKKIKKVVFDRSGYKYHGRVKSLAQGAKEGGLKF